MPRPRLAADGFDLRAVEPGDIEAIRRWRNAQMDVLRQTAPIAPDAQIRYFERHVWPEKPKAEPAQILLALEREGDLIGYGGLVHISWPNRRAEVSFLLTPDLERDAGRRAEIFERFLRALQRLAFAELGIERLYTETFAQRTDHIATLEAAGFRREGCMRAHILMDGARQDALIHGCLCTDWMETDT